MVSTPQIASSSGSDSKDGQIGRERPDNHNAPFHAQLNSIPQSFDRGATHPTQPYEPHLPFDMSGVPEGAVLTDGISASPQLVVSSASQITATLGEQQGETVPDRVTLNLKVPEKYFIVKSLTMQDLEASVQNGVWATQTHNEEALNKAFEAADNVYLIFSANKSGEYYGYARMTSLSLTIPTPATETAPKGHIIDDSARGTIFWEAETADFEQDLPKKGGESGQEEDLQQDQDWGRPFSIEWISTNRLPFYRTRGLRNPWNANREVKIARDGTELEPSVGKRLVQMFHRIAQPHAGAAQGTPQAFVQTQSY
ncbi:hypothetical protein H2203_001538 [Taxawa tesnikishii (nom. ined.)]|nr:hypothetical protein H2203_001538 [Dothideales sp. JES 119]